MTFFVSGALLLTAALTGLWMWMRGTRHARIATPGGQALSRLGVRNAARYPTRSLLTLAALTVVVFLVIVVVSFVRGLDASLVVSGDPRVVLVHSQAEQNVLYKKMEKSDDEKTRKFVFEGLNEHQIVEQQLQQMSRARSVACRSRPRCKGAASSPSSSARPRPTGGRASTTTIMNTRCRTTSAPTTAS